MLTRKQEREEENHPQNSKSAEDFIVREAGPQHIFELQVPDGYEIQVIEDASD